jgi:hypothetical protein
MDNNDYVFEERKQENKNYSPPNIHNVNDMEFNKGGGGGGPHGFFSIRTNVYSKECFSDPNNPGKMICKETSNSSGYNPFNKENNYKKTKENIYTNENNSYTGNLYDSRNRNNYENNEPSMFDKM